MEVIIVKSYEEVGQVGADIIATAILHKPDLVIGLATGTTPLGTYAELVRKHKNGGLDFSKVATFNLDEYLGLPMTHPQSYYYFMWENLFKHVNINPENIHVPSGQILDHEKFCLAYEDEIEECGGIDIQLLGIGRDGHIGFNEPGSSLGSRTRLKTLTRETIEDNARLFDDPDEVPRFAVTMGVGTCLDARKVLLIANGAGKAEAIAGTIEGPVSSQCTASALQLHPNAMVVVDEAAASKLKRREYYDWIRNNKKQIHEVIDVQIRKRLNLEFKDWG